MTDEATIPIGITRHEDGSIEVGPVRDQACPVCGFEHIRSTLGFSSAWDPSEAAVGECDECGTEFNLVAVAKSDSE